MCPVGLRRRSSRGLLRGSVTGCVYIWVHKHRHGEDIYAFDRYYDYEEVADYIESCNAEGFLELDREDEWLDDFGPVPITQIPDSEDNIPGEADEVHHYNRR